jgi:hypothetical protein
VSRSRIVYLVEAWSSCAWYRCYTPGEELRRRGYEVHMATELSQEAADWADVVVFERQSEPEILDAIAYCRSQGKLTVYEIDDDVWNIHRDSAAHPYFSRPGVLETMDEAIRSCAIVTTTTRQLASRVRALNANVHILPNMLPDDHWPFDRPKEQAEDKVVIGWAGSDTHLPDLRQLEGVIDCLLDRYDQVEFAWAGMSEMPFPGHERMRCIEGVPINDYPSLVSQFHIGLAPVIDTVFNRAKSDLKFLEYAAIGIPVAASRTPTYENSVENGVNGFLASNAKDWLKYLSRLIEDVSLRRDMGAKAQAWARTRLISRNISMWEAAYALDLPETGVAG